MTATALLRVPVGTVGVVQTEFGNATIDSNGFVTVDARAVPALLAAGFRDADIPLGGSQTVSNTDGLFPFTVPLLNGKNAAGTGLAAAAAAGTFGMSVTPGTLVGLIGESCQNTTKTDVVLYDIELPENYKAGQDIAVTISAGWTGTGAGATSSIDLSAYRQTGAGAQGADLVTTNAQTLATGAVASYTFVVAGATLLPQDRLTLKITHVAIETGNANPIVGVVRQVSVA